MKKEDWNRRYSDAELLWTAEPNRFLVEEVEALAPGRALDLASGEGRNAAWLAERGWTVDAVDFSSVAIARGRRMARERGLELRCIEADVETWSIASRGYDLVILFYLHLPWTRMRAVLHRAAEAVAPRGVFLLVGHDLTNLEHGHGGPKSADVLYEPEEVAEELGGLEIEQAERRERPVDTDDGVVMAIDCLLRARRPGA